MPTRSHRTPPAQRSIIRKTLRRPARTSQDPAAEQFKYQVSLDVRDLVSLEVRRYTLPRGSEPHHHPGVLDAFPPSPHLRCKCLRLGRLPPPSAVPRVGSVVLVS
jgi:hypothetical protein